MIESVSPVNLLRFEEGILEEKADLLAGEEPLEIRLKYYDGIDFREKRLSVTMRTPGHDFELAAGFLLSEGIISSNDDIDKIFYCQEVKAPEEEGNVIIVHLKKEKSIDNSIFNRNFYVNSSCGVCGKSSIESIEVMCTSSFSADSPMVQAADIPLLSERARSDQSVFEHTGGLHASALFSPAGELLMIREDIGRHNALDKIIGAAAIKNDDMSDKVLFVSGRSGFELVQKAVVAGIPFMISVGAPSSLAVSLAQERNMTLVGFSRNGNYNVYSGKQRIQF